MLTDDKGRYGREVLTFKAIAISNSESPQTFTVSRDCGDAMVFDDHDRFGDALTRIAFDDFDSEAVSIAVGPLPDGLNWESPCFHPTLWAVYCVRSGRPGIVGYLDQPSASKAAKRLHDAGKCVIIATPYLASY